MHFAGVSNEGCDADVWVEIVDMKNERNIGTKQRDNEIITDSTLISDSKRRRDNECSYS